MKKTPLLVSIIITTLFFSILGLAGSGSVYANEEQKLLTTPYLSRVFTGMNKGIKPWDILNSQKRSTAKEAASVKKAKEEEMKNRQIKLGEDAEVVESVNENGSTSGANGSKKTLASPSPSPTYTPRYEPLRESTYDEYISHVSADIYGDAGVKFAKSYNHFINVDYDYFDDALFIGDSRTVGLRNYTELSNHADFLCETSLTIWKALESNFGGAGTVESFLDKKEYSKIYLMVGVNELGTGTTEDFISEYTKVVDFIHEKEPDAIIFIQAIMNIDKERSTTDSVFNNTNILGRNNAIATLADNETFFYIDMNPAVCDEEGFLRDDLRGDHLHLLGSSNRVWESFIMSHGVSVNGYKEVVPSATPEVAEESPSESPDESETASPSASQMVSPSAAETASQAPAEAASPSAAPADSPVSEVTPSVNPEASENGGATGGLESADQGTLENSEGQANTTTEGDTPNTAPENATQDNGATDGSVPGGEGAGNEGAY